MDDPLLGQPLLVKRDGVTGRARVQGFELDASSLEKLYVVRYSNGDEELFTAELVRRYMMPESLRGRCVPGW